MSTPDIIQQAIDSSSVVLDIYGGADSLGQTAEQENAVGVITNVLGAASTVLGFLDDTVLNDPVVKAFTRAC